MVCECEEDSCRGFDLCCGVFVCLFVVCLPSCLFVCFFRVCFFVFVFSWCVVFSVCPRLSACVCLVCVRLRALWAVCLFVCLFVCLCLFVRVRSETRSAFSDTCPFFLVCGLFRLSSFVCVCLSRVHSSACPLGGLFVCLFSHRLFGGLSFWLKLSLFSQAAPLQPTRSPPPMGLGVRFKDLRKCITQLSHSAGGMTYDVFSLFPNVHDFNGFLTA
jgi:hypothetical protein